MTDHYPGPPPEIVALRRKFARAVKGVGRVTKSKTANIGEDRDGRPKYSYSYVSLNDVIEAVEQGLEPEGLVFTQPIEIVDGNMVIQTLIFDTDSGESLIFNGPGCPVKGDPQAAGSAITYFRRYALTSLFGMQVDDDDAGVAHRQAVAPQGRTAAEREIRAGIDKMQDDEKAAFMADFKEEFGTTLTSLPESRHGDALGFYKFWTKPEPDAPATPTTEGDT
jgi:hypothetical protein